MKPGGAAESEAGIVALGTYPTPVAKLAPSLWVKRDDLVAPLYGGNKVRKLEHLLAEARDKGRTRLLTIGAAGSHQVVAAAIYGRSHGFEVDVVLVPQPSSEHAIENLRVALAHGITAHAAPAWGAAPAVLAAQWGRDAYVIPLGGSSAVGTLGYVAAAAELAEQVARGELPEPEAVVVALGSGGTAAGLAVGFERAGLRTRVVGVVVSHPKRVLGAMAERLVRKTAELVGLPRDATRRAVQRLEVDARFIGRGYGYSTSEGEAATRAAAELGLMLDPTYTAKSFACALERAPREKSGVGPVLYWHTLSTAPLGPLLRGHDEPLPPKLARLFR